MKKKYIIMIIIVALILMTIAGWFIYKEVQKNAREYDVQKIDIKDYAYFVLRQEGKYGVINKAGEVIINPEYTNLIIPNPQRGIFICYDENNNTKVFNQNREQIFTQYNQIQPIRLKNIVSDLMYEKNIVTYEQDGKMGIINLEGKIVAKPIYETIEGLPYKEGELLIKLEEKYGVINNKGNYLVEPVYDQIAVDNYTTEQNGYKKAGYIVSNTTDDGYRYGYVDVNGKVILETEYTEISRMIDIQDDNAIFLVVAQNGQYGVFKNDEQLINMEYQSIAYNSENNTLTLEKTKRFGVATIDGKIILPVEFTQIDSVGMYIYATNPQKEVQVYKNDGTRAKIDSHIYIKQTDNEKYQIQIDNAKGSVYSIINQNGEKLTTADYAYIEYLYDDYFIVSIAGGKLGIINVNEEPIIPIQYDSIERLDGTDNIVAKLSENNTIQIYNRQLNKICEMTNAIIRVQDNYIHVYNDTQTKYFDLQGNEKQNTEILPNNQIYAKVQDGKWGFVDKSGNVIIDYTYDKVTELNRYGVAGVKLNGKWGVVNTNGEVIVEPTYTFNTLIEPEFIKEYYKVEYGYGEFYYTK